MYEDWTMEELQAEEDRIAEAINERDAEAMCLKEEMVALNQEAEPIRIEIENRKRAAAARSPLTQGIGG